MATQSSGRNVLVRVQRLLGTPLRRPRLKLRGAVILIAVLAVMMGFVAASDRRRDHDRRMYASHYQQARRLWDDAIYGAHGRGRREQLLREAKQQDALAEEFRRASDRPW